MKGENQNASSPADIRERSFSFALRIVKLCQSLDAEPGPARILGRQLLRSGTSIGANIEEARETHYWLRLLTAADLVPATRLAPLTDEANQLIAILTTIVKKCRRSAD